MPQPTLPCSGLFFLLLLAGACAPSDAQAGSAMERLDADTLLLLADLRATQTRLPVDPHIGRERKDDAAAVRRRSRGLESTPPDVTLEFVLRASDAAAPGSERRTRMLRSSDRIQLSWPDSAELWTFTRNPVTPDELSAVRVDHASQFLIEYSDSELYSEGVVDGWARLAQVFVAPEDLDGLQPTGATVEAFGLTFERWSAASQPEAAQNALVELDWNADYALPLRLVRRSDSGLRVQELSLLDLAPSPDELTPPEVRWPAYAVKDLSDWREDVHAGHDH